jgi:tRNA A37 threonylcarbamoyladenosine synthetase subunit TsaC/SUA5/YrdC
METVHGLAVQAPLPTYVTQVLGTRQTDKASPLPVHRQQVVGTDGAFNCFVAGSKNIV